MKGILFKDWKIKAIAEDDREWQTRRVIKQLDSEFEWEVIDVGEPIIMFKDGIGGCIFLSPRYQVSEVVYVKEAYQVRGGDYSKQTAWIVYPDGIELTRKIPMYYSWDKAMKPCYTKLNGSMPTVSPLFMPEWAARYFIKITDIRAERLQEITLTDIRAEGIGQEWLDARGLFRGIWNSINAKYPWESNPWVFPYSFKKAEK